MIDEKLKNLQIKLARDIGYVPNLEALLEDSKLVLRLNLGKGFEGYEHFNASYQDEGYYLEYFGLFSNAFDTFSLDKEGDFNYGDIIESFREEVAKIKKEGKVEIHEPKINKIYSQIINLSRKGVSYEEAEKAFDYFLDAFERKAS